MAQAQASLLPDLAPVDAATPLMAQYLAVKAQHKDCLVFFRLGDFYEMFFEDAVQASKALDIALTRRGQMNGQDVPMCGVPAHSYEGYLAKLIRKGFRVALCEQTEAPAEAKKRGAKSIVTRDVVRIITPGTITEDSLLDTKASNFLSCLAGNGDDLAISWLDLATAQPCTQSLSVAELSGALARLHPAEILVPQKLIEAPDLFEILSQWRDQLTPQPNSRFDSDNGEKRLLTLYNVKELTAFGDFTRAEVASLGALLDYAELTQKSDLKHLARPQKMALGHTLAIDPATRRNLELTRTLSGERQGSLLATIDYTVTGAGARLLAARLQAPLTAMDTITDRLEAVECMVRHSTLREAVRKALRHAPDLERALARVALKRGGPRDLASIRDAAKQSEVIRSDVLKHAKDMPAELQQATKNLGEHGALTDRLQRALAADLPMLARDGNFIARGYAAHLDELVALRDDSRRLIAGLQQKYIGVSGAATLKIRHNNVIGYYLEVTPTHADKLLANKDLFIHRQSLASAVRFTTVELSELERKINEAGDKALAVELQLFDDLVTEVLQRLESLRRTAEAMAVLDVTAALAELSVQQKYVRPIIDNSFSFHIKGGRHPVVELALRENRSTQAFIANDCDLAHDKKLWLLTGPNMAGKSTFLRQNALIALLAQMGSFVPAEHAHIGIIDRLFSRVGAADDLARGRSTFMVEMVETAAILNQATSRSFVILDEIGRGTATYDGLSIAWATLEHLVVSNKCRALFATHYHELTSLQDKLDGLRCHTMRIKEWEGSIIFLHEVIEGVADRSYGIHVAQMAGLPATVIARAEQVLATLESDNTKSRTGTLSDNLPAYSATPPAPADTMKPELKKILQALAPDDLSPKDALELVYRIKKLT